MSRSTLSWPSPGTVMGTLALVVALAGNANAFSDHLVVRKGDIAKGAVTASALAQAAVHAKALAKEAVTAKAIKQGAVNSGALASDAVTAPAIAPGAVYGGALGPMTVHAAPIGDLDTSADLSTWTSSPLQAASCELGERMLTGGVLFTNVGNGRVAVTTSVPTLNSAAGGWVGQITSDSGGTAAAEVVAVCLK